MSYQESNSNKPIYEEFIDRIDYETLPNGWQIKNGNVFSESKKLYEYQVNALKNATKLLYHFYKDMNNFNDNEIKERKKEFYNEIKRIEKNIEKLSLDDDNEAVKEILNYYDYEETFISPRRKVKRIHFYNFVNRSGFWMATGSGKTLVIIKLIELLNFLISGNKIPNNDILILTYRDDLITQIREHINEFNTYHNKNIDVYDLKEYDRVKSGSYLLNKDNINIFIYRSDLIFNETKEKQLSYLDIDNNGKWYIILDEAHKGNKEDSKRQIYYSFLTRNGFLFNFSATFTDPWDIVTTVFNFNLDKFIESGYGKNIYVSQKNIGNFKEFDYNEKEKIVLKSLILLTAIKKALNEIRIEVKENIYHNPLMVVYGNSVNTDYSDLEIFFKVLERIALNQNEDNYKSALNDILDEIKEHPRYVFGHNELKIYRNFIESINYGDILNYVYNSDTFGKIEAIKIPGNNQDIVFKLKTSDKPFAMIRMGDIAEWIKNKLKNYEINEAYDNKNYFQGINDENSALNILMGSRTFYEGWDSNRPNVMVFVNIGVGDSKKYILQSIGRGERIEPFKNMRKRLSYLSIEEGKAKKFLNVLEDYEVSLIESLFIFGTKVENIERIMESIKFERNVSGFQIELNKNKDISQELLIPVYVEEKPELNKIPKFEGNYDLLKDYINWIGDDRILYAIYNEQIKPVDVEKVKNYLRPENFKTNNNGNAYSQMSDLYEHINMRSEKFDKFKKLEEEIIHFKQISAIIDEGQYNELERIVESYFGLSKQQKTAEELTEKLRKGEIDDKKFNDEYKKIKWFDTEEISLEDTKLKLENIPHHYYVPVIISEDYKSEFITHIIDEKSEVKFIEDLEKYTNNNDIDCDFWYFSKIDQTTDKVYIPYYNNKQKKGDKFYPDFVFWIKKGNNYNIIFVDPKSIEYTDYESKVDGYSKIFEEYDKPRSFTYYSMNIRVFLLLYTEDSEKLSEKYKRYWIDDPRKIFEII